MTSLKPWIRLLLLMGTTRRPTYIVANPKSPIKMEQNNYRTNNPSKGTLVSGEITNENERLKITH